MPGDHVGTFAHRAVQLGGRAPPTRSREMTFMQRALALKHRDRILTGVPFVEALARRVASSMPHTIDLGDLVQDGMIGLIDAAHRFDPSRGIKFETFAERRVRGAMIDALRRDAWPRGVRRVRRELEAAREALRRELGYEPSLADLAARVGSDETRLGRTIVRINTIESTSPLASGDGVDGSSLPPALVPSEPPAPDKAYAEKELRERVRRAIASLPWRERKVVGLYYYGEVTMKQIGAEIGVNESRVSQLHARAIQRLRKALGPDLGPDRAAAVLRPVLLAFQKSAVRPAVPVAPVTETPAAPAAAAATGTDGLWKGVLLPYDRTSRATRSKSPSLNGFASQRQPLSSRKRSASVPTTSPVTNITRRASAGVVAAIAR
jgi:RNA polymerase sigma factor for flagellar operon FliA